MTYRRRPVRFAVMVDGRMFGHPYRTSGLANAAADAILTEAPWCHVEVATVWP